MAWKKRRSKSFSKNRGLWRILAKKERGFVPDLTSPWIASRRTSLRFNTVLEITGHWWQLASATYDHIYVDNKQQVQNTDFTDILGLLTIISPRQLSLHMHAHTCPYVLTDLPWSRRRPPPESFIVVGVGKALFRRPCAAVVGALRLSWCAWVRGRPGIAPAIARAL